MQPTDSSVPGRIVLVGTPVGNLGDMAPRASEVLASAGYIACEDTRRTGRLLSHLGIAAPKLLRMDEHTEAQLVPRLLSLAEQGALVAVTSDAGMPGLSDPGGRLVAAAADAGVQLEVVPGPFAGAMAAVLSGLLDPSGRFTFEGFLPRRGVERSRAMHDLSRRDRASVIYESPHRVAATVVELGELCGIDRKVSLSREMTKLHEETWRGTLGEAAEHLESNRARGEYVIVLDEAPARPEATDQDLLDALAARIEAGESRRDAAAAVAEAMGVAPNRVKRIANR
jgi:16S rRNA (cytidine1402-2'-O)-methyltransferase